MNIWISIICVVVVAAFGYLLYKWSCEKERVQSLEDYVHFLSVENSNLEVSLTAHRDAVAELERRDNVAAYNALDAGRSEQDDRILELEAENESITTQFGAVVNDLREHITFLHRAQALHLQTIIEQEKELEGPSFTEWLEMEEGIVFLKDE